MNKIKRIALVGIWLLSVLAGTSLAATIKLVWDHNAPAEEVGGYIVYEIRGTNYVRIAAVATNEYTLNVEPGLHIYTVTATNWWGLESPFSVPVRTPPMASAPTGQRAVKVPELRSVGQ